MSFRGEVLGEKGFSHESLSTLRAYRSWQNLIFAFLKLSLVVLVVLSLSGLSIGSSPSPSGPPPGVVSDLTQIGKLSLGIARLKELEFCPPQYESYVPCNNNVSQNLDSVDPVVQVEYKRKCSRGTKQGCLILPPRNYRIPLRWASGRDFIWEDNDKITGRVFSAGSLTKT
ncbi:hypothetical protein ZIOFF_060127 [Zingiber officinale]|uniref:Methyltransferase n=1 Tax=Zingiber officinale TaxID=94328 RepID=A0A8J5FAA2_ZINOF|nr:hypothetical protein ZIOFF_060127 [Zingiber officinale]